VFWKTGAVMIQGRLFALTRSNIGCDPDDDVGNHDMAVHRITLWTPIHLTYLAMAHAKLGHMKEAFRYIELAMTAIETTNELLSPVYGWFTEGFDTLDLKQAKALIDELAR
jgi:hypothetical protein